MLMEVVYHTPTIGIVSPYKLLPTFKMYRQEVIVLLLRIQVTALQQPL